MSISFPYEKKRIEEGELVDPRIVVEVKTNWGFLKIKFLVDSGADVTTLPYGPYASLFGFRKDPKKKVVIGGIEGAGVSAYPFKITCRLGARIFTTRCYFVDSWVDPLLGRLDFWDLYTVTFDNSQKKTLLDEL